MSAGIDSYGLLTTGQALLDQLAGHSSDGCLNLMLCKSVSPTPKSLVRTDFQNYVYATSKVSEHETLDLLGLALAGWAAR